ncbi:GGDEF [Novosphingobium sp. PY1]|uniref:diguanylate cyclase n=2 Tax=Alphaproteobacteria TaxID=28211 RepID=A0A292GS67_9HYPH|nr:GGDEF [Ochrobactrum sp. PW1]GFM29168.1 GGDEF [Novosphingobium sp. PY1]
MADRGGETAVPAMWIDLSTLYFLAIGTLLLSAGMLFWEGQSRPKHLRAITCLAAGFGTLAVGCALALARGHLPGALGAIVANMVMMAGYLLVFEGTAALGGHRRRAISLTILIAVGLMWTLSGARGQHAVWNYVSALPIALVSGLTMWEMCCNDSFRALRARRVVIAFTALHTLFYAGRAFVLPVLAPIFGAPLLTAASTVTMYEGVLYSVGLPMALMALFREEAHEQVLTASRTDYLTNLGNRRWFFEDGERFLHTWGGDGRVFLLAFDLDHFKSINDRFGHAMGDEVLKLFARFARRAVGHSAILARIGGEEFAALLPCRSSTEAMALAQGVVSRFAEAVADPDAGLGVRATVSIGLAELGVDGTELPILLSAADSALYQAKASGRNRIVLAKAQPFAVAN